jgi:hypothetical protein
MCVSVECCELQVLSSILIDKKFVTAELKHSISMISLNSTSVNSKHSTTNINGVFFMYISFSQLSDCDLICSYYFIQVSKMGVTSILVDNGVNLGALSQGLTQFSRNWNTSQKNKQKWLSNYSQKPDTSNSSPSNSTSK